MDKELINNDFFDYLRSNVNQKHWDLWFKSLEIQKVSEENKTVILSTSNLFVRDWIITRYGKVLANAVKTFFGAGYSYELRDLQLPVVQENASNTQNTRFTAKKPLEICSLNPQYTFDNFVPGNSNILGFQSAKSSAENPGKYNPLFLYGGVGLGKTHLLQAIGHWVRTQFPEKRVLYISSEQFMNDLVQSIKQDKIENFRQKYRTSIDVLLIDDIQFLIGKMGIQNELFHTFNSLFDSGKQIAFCSDRTPKDLGTFHERLISRFQMGLVVELMAPDIETRKKIIEKISFREKIPISPSVTAFLAQSVKDNIRKVYGTLVKLCMVNQLQGKKIDVQTLKEILDEDEGKLNQADTEVIQLHERDRFFSVIERAFSISKEELISSSRAKDLSEVRKIAMYIANKNLKIPVVELARWFSKTHSTVNYAIAKTEENIQQGYASTTKKIEQLSIELSRMKISAHA